MSSYTQVSAIAQLSGQGWKVLGPADNSMGGRTLMENPEDKEINIG